MICRVVDEFNCTPTQAVYELRHNPRIYRLLRIRSYTRAYEAVQSWDSMSDKQRAHVTQPSGSLVVMVRRNNRAVFEQQQNEREQALAQEGRI